ncbi:leucyl/phenylalanyl-tRNA--protein transferase [Robiginitalea aurantiaca]|uniref:Leucyl/phenylalanyl-tRNA--protein transferase n=1 Tax=Robiginitalea aurantiaca TaxID=3056915 RepID=A0ABT7WEK7_9FLAO|nr:leucyl/phenylalanyl-tRNA--protein transferase [Robiginitalea aurantiaca]MDM9631356.1 leucyl/phenylalanyl-tRNA--protein transferase [Robiginitalea aurantiaca]
MKSQHIPVPILNQSLIFPPVSQATSEGLLAVGGDLSTDRLMLAYRSGVFPWFSDDSLLLWWSPDPRAVLFPHKLKVSRSMRQLIQKGRFTVTRNRSFTEVITHCATVYRKEQEGTWITERMLQAYEALHNLGHAISYEVWEGTELVGGLYGIDLGHVFCGESMFSLVSNASKVAFIQLVQDLEAKNYSCVDCQVYSQHLGTLGAEEIPRASFLELL